MRYFSQLFQNKYSNTPIDALEKSIMQMLNSKGFEVVTNNIKYLLVI